MNRPQPNAQGQYRILWPEDKLVSPATLMSWAGDDVSDQFPDDAPYRCTSIDEAIDILLESGSVTFARQA